MDATKYVAEFIGTFAFVLAILLIIDWVGAKNPIALSVSIGAILALLIWVALQFGGDGHLNPAVTFANLYGDYNKSGQILHFVAFICAQVVGSLAAYYVHVNITK